MFVVCIHCTGRPVRTAEQSSMLDRAKLQAHFIASEMPGIITVTVRHHKHMDEVYYSMKGQM